MKFEKRNGVSPVIATLLLIVIAIAAAIIVYAFVTGLIGGLTNSTNSLVTETGTLTVPSGTGTGSLIVTIKNSASNPITEITVQTDGADLGVTATWGPQNGAAGGQGGPAGASVATYLGSLAIGQSVSATALVTGLTAGTTYTFTVLVTFNGGGTQAQTLSVTAQI